VIAKDEEAGVLFDHHGLQLRGILHGPQLGFVFPREQHGQRLLKGVDIAQDTLNLKQLSQRDYENLRS
jgi:hypothetical protein